VSLGWYRMSGEYQRAGIKQSSLQGVSIPIPPKVQAQPCNPCMKRRPNCPRSSLLARGSCSGKSIGVVKCRIASKKRKVAVALSLSPKKPNHSQLDCPPYSSSHCRSHYSDSTCRAPRPLVAAAPAVSCAYHQAGS